MISDTSDGIGCSPINHPEEGESGIGSLIKDDDSSERGWKLMNNITVQMV